MIALPVKNFFYLFFSFFNILAAFTQPWEILRQKNAGTVEIRLVIVYLVSCLFWIGYAYAIKNPLLEITCPIYFINNLATLTLWLKYRNG